MKWIAGLGNPGAQYVRTPHNVGFDALDLFARRWGLNWAPKAALQAEVAEGMAANRPVTLVKPLTYMNLSGQALAKCLRQSEWSGEDLMIVFDDVNLPIGRMRLRASGSHGGQKGMKSVIAQLGGSDIPRLRIGIRPPWPVDDLPRYVLGKLPPQQRGQLDEMIEAAADALECWLGEGLTGAMDRFNRIKKFDAAPEGDGMSK